MTIKANLAAGLIKFSHVFICALLGLIFLFLSTASIVYTSIIDPHHFIEEHILYSHDNIVFNILVMFAILLLLRLLLRYSKYINPKIAASILLAYTTIIGAIWIISVKSIPASDSGFIMKSAVDFINGNYSSLQSSDSYFRYYPFQLGFTFISELLMRIFGPENYVALGIVNLISIDAAFVALVQIAKLIFDNRKTELLTIFLLAGCLQPILFCTFIYGNIIGLAFSMWAVLFELIYIKTGNKKMIFLAAVFIAIAVTAKFNYLIVLMAMCIMLLLHSLQTRQWFNFIAISFAVALTLGFNYLIISSYETRAGTELGDGAPQILWTAMGLQDSSRAPGWYNGYSLDAYKNNNLDGSAAAQQARSDIKSRLTYFRENPHYALTFFTNKVVSQWNEPTFESIWVSQIKKHNAPVPSFVEGVYTGASGHYLDIYFNIYQQIILIGFFIVLLRNLKRPNLLFMFLPLIILGGFLYHLLNEAKSQYILVYFVMLVPYAANGLYAVINAKYSDYKQLFNH